MKKHALHQLKTMLHEDKQFSMNIIGGYCPKQPHVWHYAVQTCLWNQWQIHVSKQWKPNRIPSHMEWKCFEKLNPKLHYSWHMWHVAVTKITQRTFAFFPADVCKNQCHPTTKKSAIARTKTWHTRVTSAKRTINGHAHRSCPHAWIQPNLAVTATMTIGTM